MTFDLFSAYIFADSGYDVWLPNTRGNVYSKNHTTKNPHTDPSFWDFSFWEVGTKDIPALVDYVLDQTEASKLFYIGHSQATSAYMAWLSEQPEYNSKIAAASMLAPISYLKNSDILYQTLAKVATLLEVS